MKRGGLEFVWWWAGCGGYGGFCVENSDCEVVGVRVVVGCGGRLFLSGLDRGAVEIAQPVIKLFFRCI